MPYSDPGEAYMNHAGTFGLGGPKIDPPLELTVKFIGGYAYATSNNRLDDNWTLSPVGEAVPTKARGLTYGIVASDYNAKMKRYEYILQVIVPKTPDFKVTYE